MSEIFNRLGRLARSVINDFKSDVDADFQNAWSELDDFLETEPHDIPGNQSGAGSGNTQSNWSGLGLGRDYANLEVSPSADLEDIKKQYKKLLIKYHPDKFGDNSEKQSIATELTARLNESFERIMEARGKA